VITVGRPRVEVDLPGLRTYVVNLPQVRDGVYGLAGAVARDAQAAAPYRTGRLRRSITVERATGRDAGTVHVIAGAPYAGYVEFGTRYMAARPFMRPAANKYRRRR
jgi:HK97 gp10 family phage protein